ncbi:telomeric repeat-binding factor 2-interacting protein 1-like [Patiria miniata]|uniref:Telomeric repeat-binding factor 2-interacting protein 1 n=1 Tax=Patiria miniata TaxID=46514 RepID=A0A914A0D1_PATMI|nr:telomeric repeat-binding factor 2-interacting protein 1-like [Patiria miniata]
MADDSSPVSSFLFCKEDGEPINFVIRPSAAKARLKPLIEKRGGVVSSKLHDNQDYIKLAVEGDKIASDDYITVQYIDDCIEANQLLPMDKYRVHQQQPRPPSPANSTISNVSFKGRSKYSSSEDTAILTYIAKRPDCRYAGNQIWQKMELLKVTDHSWQSMKHRFLKKLVDDLPKYTKLEEEQTEKDVSSPGTSSGEKDVIADSSTSNQKETSLKTPRKEQTQPVQLGSNNNPNTSESEPTDQGKDSNPETEAQESIDGSDSVYDDCLLQVAEENTPKKMGCSSKGTEMFSDSAEEHPQTRKRNHRSRQVSSNAKGDPTMPNVPVSTDSTKESTNASSSNNKETSLKTPSREQTQPVQLASNHNPNTSESEPADGGKDPNPKTVVRENNNGSSSDFDDYLIQAAEENSPRKIGCSSEVTETFTDAAEGRPPPTRKRHAGNQVSSNKKGDHTEPNRDASTDSTEEKRDDGVRSSKRRRRHRSHISDTEELVAGVLGDVDTCSEPESSDSSSTDPHFQAHVNRVIAFVKEVVEDYSVPVFTVMQLLYFHSLNLDAVLNHLQTGESDVVWTKENDEKLSSGKPEDLEELCNIYGRDEVMRRHAFFDV